MGDSDADFDVFSASLKPEYNLDSLAGIVHEDSTPRDNSAKQVALSPEKRGPPHAEWDQVGCDALLVLVLNRKSVNSVQGSDCLSRSSETAKFRIVHSISRLSFNAKLPSSGNCILSAVRCYQLD